MKTQNTFIRGFLSKKITLTISLVIFSLCCSMSLSAKKVVYGEISKMDLEPKFGYYRWEPSLVLKYGELPARDSVFEIPCSDGAIQWPDSDMGLYVDSENPKSEIWVIEIDSTFKEVRLKSTANMFAGFSSLMYIGGFKYLNTESVTDMSKMFYRCGSLIFSDTPPVAYDDDGNLLDIGFRMYFDFSTFNTQNVTRMDSMFAYAFMYGRFSTGYSHAIYPFLELGNFDTRNVTSMSGMFAHCQGRVLSFNSFDTHNVTDMSGMFYNYYNDDDSWDWYMEPDDPNSYSEVCSRPDLNSEDINQYKMQPYMLDLRSFDTRNVKNMSEMFKECSGVTEIVVGEGWTTESVKKDDGSKQMFEECLFLKGALGTAYDETHLDAAYAHPDGGVDNPGYLTGVSQLDAVPLIQTEQTVDVWASDGQLFIKVENASEYRIYDMFGRIVAQGTIAERETSISLPRQTIYFVVVNGVGTKVMVD